jgi:hypothetical protein
MGAVMMNVPTEVASKVAEALKGTPFVLALLIVNTIALTGFGYSLHEISNAADRRDTLLQTCIGKLGGASK